MKKHKISIVIPVHNEEKFLQSCLDAIKDSAEGLDNPIEIVVVLNRCTDASSEIAKKNNCLIVYNNAKNLSVIRNAGISSASGEIIVTIDADSRMSKNMLPKILETLASGKYIGGGVNIIPDRLSLGIICSMLALAPFVIFWGISAGVFFAFKKDILAINGFNEEMYSAEDVDFARRLKKYGKTQNKKFKNLFSAYILTSARKFDTFGDWYAFKNPLTMLRLLKGKKSAEADKIWYDYNS